MRWVQLAAVVVIGLLMWACGGAPSPAPQAAAPTALPAAAAKVESPSPAAQPIKIGFLIPLTGPFADPGKDLEAGARLALSKLGGKIAGRPVELLIEDTEANPDVGLSKARRLTEQRGAQFLMGIYHGGVGQALAGYAKNNKIVTVISGAAGTYPIMYEVKPQPYVFRLSQALRAVDAALGYYATKVLGYKRAVALNYDYAAGQDAVAGFTNGFEAGGGQVVKKVFFKLGTTDFAPYFAAIPSEADVMHTLVSGADAVRFVKQYAELGYKNKVFPAMSGFGISDRILPELGDTALGVVLSSVYSVDLPTTGNREFVEAYRKATGNDPGPEGAISYSSMLAVAQAIEGIGGAVENQDRLISALKGIQVDSVRGPVRLNEMNDIIHNVYMTKVVKDGPRYKLDVQTIYKDVHTLWQPGQ